MASGAAPKCCATAVHLSANTFMLRRRPEVGRITEAGDGDAALAALRQGDVDLVFLDVQMPGRDGLAVARAIGAGQLPVVVFVTAFDQHAVTAFELAAVDYLLKPFDDDRFADAFERARRRLAGDSLATFRDRLVNADCIAHIERRWRPESTASSCGMERGCPCRAATAGGCPRSRGERGQSAQTAGMGGCAAICRATS